MIFLFTLFYCINGILAIATKQDAGVTSRISLPPPDSGWRLSKSWRRWKTYLIHKAEKAKHTNPTASPKMLMICWVLYLSK